MNGLISSLLLRAQAAGRTLMVHKAIVALIVLVLIGLGVVGFFGVRYLALTEDQALASERQIDEAVRKIGRLIELPEGETPTLAVVRETESLKNDPFFADARPGDIVLYYPVANVAFVYRPSKDMLVNASTEAGAL
jgi:hypothetical protein